jgi:hypothetical protein
MSEKLNESEIINDIMQDILEVLMRTDSKPTLPDLERCARKIFYDLKMIIEREI